MRAIVVVCVAPVKTVDAMSFGLRSGMDAFGREVLTVVFAIWCELTLIQIRVSTMLLIAKQEQSTSSLQCLGAVATASSSSRTNVYRAKTSDLHEAISGLAPNLI